MRPFAIRGMLATLVAAGMVASAVAQDYVQDADEEKIVRGQGPRGRQGQGAGRRIPGRAVLAGVPGQGEELPARGQERRRGLSWSSRRPRGGRVHLLRDAEGRHTAASVLPRRDQGARRRAEEERVPPRVPPDVDRGGRRLRSLQGEARPPVPSSAAPTATATFVQVDIHRPKASGPLGERVGESTPTPPRGPSRRPTARPVPCRPRSPRP